MSHNAPTPKQLAYLRSLAISRGQTFVVPRTRAEASAEIHRLRYTRSSSRWDRRLERWQISRDMAFGRGDAARVRGREITGYGSSATWR